MELIDIYNLVSNPIEDETNIEKIIRVYAKSSEGFGGFYNNLNKMREKNYVGQYNEKDADIFYANMFNKWKNSIVNMSRIDFIKGYQQHSFDKDLIKLRKYLSTIPDVKTKQEAQDIMFSKKEYKDLDKAMDKYRWNAFGEGSSWQHVYSRYLTGKKDKMDNVEHRLYLNIESIYLHRFANLFVELCEKHQVPYYFKFNEFVNRDDTFIIYSSSNNISKYIDILQEIKDLEPNLVENIKEPPILSGKIDNWIGYGSEPLHDKYGKIQSFNEKRGKVIEQSIESVTKKWILNHRDDVISYIGKEISFTDYLAIRAANKLLSDLKRKCEYYENNAKENNKSVSNSSISNMIGYSSKDLNSKNWKNNILQYIKSGINNSIVDFCNNNGFQEIVIKGKNGKNIIFSEYDMHKIMQEITVGILRNDPNYIKNIKKQIIKNSYANDIDSNKFCFDIHITNNIKKSKKVDNANINKDNNLNDEDRNEYIIKLNEFIKQMEIKYGISWQNFMNNSEKDIFTNLYSIVYDIKPNVISEEIDNQNTKNIEPFKNYVNNVARKYGEDWLNKLSNDEKEEFINIYSSTYNITLDEARANIIETTKKRHR